MKEIWWCDDEHKVFFKAVSPRAACVDPNSEFADRLEKVMRPVTLEEYYKYELYE